MRGVRAQGWGGAPGGLGVQPPASRGRGPCSEPPCRGGALTAWSPGTPRSPGRSCRDRPPPREAPELEPGFLFQGDPGKDGVGQPGLPGPPGPPGPVVYVSDVRTRCGGRSLCLDPSAGCSWDHQPPYRATPRDTQVPGLRLGAGAGGLLGFQGCPLVVWFVRVSPYSGCDVSPRGPHTQHRGWGCCPPGAFPSHPRDLEAKAKET